MNISLYFVFPHHSFKARVIPRFFEGETKSRNNESCSSGKRSITLLTFLIKKGSFMASQIDLDTCKILSILSAKLWKLRLFHRNLRECWHPDGLAWGTQSLSNISISCRFLRWFNTVKKQQPQTITILMQVEVARKTIRRSNHFIPTASTSHFILRVDTFRHPSALYFPGLTVQRSEDGQVDRQSVHQPRRSRQRWISNSCVIDLKLWGWRQLVNLWHQIWDEDTVRICVSVHVCALLLCL